LNLENMLNLNFIKTIQCGSNQLKFKKALSSKEGLINLQILSSGIYHLL
jgi:hypothetical protein